MPSIAAQRVPEDRTDKLKIHEIFCSIQGEANAMGWPTVFVRLTGCPLRCTYCDTEYAFFGGGWMSFAEIQTEVAGHGVKHVCVTGGEPLAQKRCLQLLTRLCDDGFQVSLETSGAIDISPVDPRVARVVDWKTPGSGEAARNLDENLANLRAGDQLKFVICDREDYDWARDVARSRAWPEGVTLFFSPSWGQVEARDLAEWIVADALPVRFQVQLHKYLWGEEPGR